MDTFLGPRISLVIPAYNEEKYIAPTLESVARAKTRYECETGRRVEVIVVDNASTDRTAELARAAGYTVVPFDKHQMAAVRNAGAAEASGEIIAFVDADRSIVPEDVFLEIDRNLSDPKIFGGGSRFKPERSNFAIWFGVTLVRFICFICGIGCVLYYMRRADFIALGGWNENLFAAEDVELSFRMKRAARQTHRRLRNLRGRVSVCMRKFDSLTPYQKFVRVFLLLARMDFKRQDRVHWLYYDADKLR